MTTWTYTAETGLASGTAVSLANSNDGTAGFAWTPVEANGGSTVYSSASPLRGALSILFSSPATNDVARAEIAGVFSSTNLVLDLAFRTPTYPGGASTRLIELFNGTVVAMRVAVSTAGKIEVYDSNSAMLWASSASISTSTNGWRLGLRVVAATATTGRLQFSYYNTKTATSATESMTTITNGDFGTGAIDTMRIGKCNSTPTWAALYSDDWQISDTNTVLFDAPAGGGSSGATINAGANQTGVEPWTTVTLTATSSTGSATWAWVSGPRPTLLGSGALVRTFVAPPNFAVTTSVFQASNGTVSDTMSVTYLPATDGLVTSTGPVVVQPVRMTKKA